MCFKRLSLISGFLLSLLSANSIAHTPFIAPISFAPAHQQWVSLDAGFAETFFHPDVAFDKGDFKLLTPAGEWQKPSRIEMFTTRTLIEHQLQEKGTYRFSTGTRYGAVFRFYELNGERKATRDPKEILPKGAKLLDHYQSVTLAETYITFDKPTTEALKPQGKGLELIAITHPDDIYAGENLSVQVLFDGKPLKDVQLTVYAANLVREKEEPYLRINTNTKGGADLLIKDAGVYLLHLRHTAVAPKGAEAPKYGYVYTLSFLVAPALDH